MADLLEMEGTRLRQTESTFRVPKRHAQSKHTLGALKRRLEIDAASWTPRSSPEKNRETKLEVLVFKDVEKVFPNCIHWDNREGGTECQKCGHFTECTSNDTRRQTASKYQRISYPSNKQTTMQSLLAQIRAVIVLTQGIGFNPTHARFLITPRLAIIKYRAKSFACSGIKSSP